MSDNNVRDITAILAERRANYPRRLSGPHEIPLMVTMFRPALMWGVPLSSDELLVALYDHTFMVDERDLLDQDADDLEEAQGVKSLVPFLPASGQVAFTTEGPFLLLCSNDFMDTPMWTLAAVSPPEGAIGFMFKILAAYK